MEATSHSLHDQGTRRKTPAGEGLLLSPEEVARQLLPAVRQSLLARDITVAEVDACDPDELVLFGIACIAEGMEAMAASGVQLDDETRRLVATNCRTFMLHRLLTNSSLRAKVVGMPDGKRLVEWLLEDDSWAAMVKEALGGDDKDVAVAAFGELVRIAVEPERIDSSTMLEELWRLSWPADLLRPIGPGPETGARRAAREVLFPLPLLLGLKPLLLSLKGQDQAEGRRLVQVFLRAVDPPGPRAARGLDGMPLAASSAKALRRLTSEQRTEFERLLATKSEEQRAEINRLLAETDELDREARADAQAIRTWRQRARSMDHGWDSIHRMRGEHARKENDYLHRRPLCHASRPRRGHHGAAATRGPPDDDGAGDDPPPPALRPTTPARHLDRRLDDTGAPCSPSLARRLSPQTQQTQARAARAVVEAALDARCTPSSSVAEWNGVANWPWSRRLSAWIDVLISIEEASTS